MKYATKLQRKKIYKDTLSHFENYQGGCVCIIMEKLIFGCVHEFSDFNAKDIAPEFYAQKPLHRLMGDVWWRITDRPIRIKAIKAAIKLCEQ